jgi:hypothetical protein
MLESLPNELYWNILKFLRHPVAEIFVEQPCYNRYLSTKGDTFDGDEVNDLIPFYELWRIYKRRPYRVIYRVVQPFENLDITMIVKQLALQPLYNHLTP